MEILHIATGFSYSKLYGELFSTLSDRGLNQKVFVPQHESKFVKNINPTDYKFDVKSSKSISKLDKVVFFTKIPKMIKAIETDIDLSSITIIHAHSLYSDGALAYMLHKKYGIPYVVAIRDTDLNRYYKLAKHLKPLASKILNNSSQIIFLSNSYKETLFQKYEKNNVHLLEQTKVIPNGIDNYWHGLSKSEKNLKKNEEIKLLFVGQVVKRKNLKTVIKVAEIMRKSGVEVILDVVGEGDLLQDFKKQYSNIGFIKFHGNVKSKEELQFYYEESDVLVVPSFTETFGLVYAEAMSCGTPVIYTKGQGFDQHFGEGKVGYSVEATSEHQIIKAIHNIKLDYRNISKNCIKGARKFNWDDIGNQYYNLYLEHEK